MTSCTCSYAENTVNRSLFSNISRSLYNLRDWFATGRDYANKLLVQIRKQLLCVMILTKYSCVNSLSIITFKSGLQVQLNNSPKASLFCDMFTNTSLLLPCVLKEERTRSDIGKFREFPRGLPSYFTPQLPVSTLFIALRIV